MADVLDFKTKTGLLGDGVEISPDQILQKTAGVFQQVVVIGFDQDGEFHVHSSHGSRETLWLIARAQHHVLVETRE